MDGDDRVAPSADPSGGGGADNEKGRLHRLMKALFDLTPWGLVRRVNLQSEELERLRLQWDSRFDGIERRLGHHDSRFDGIERSLGHHDSRFDGIERRLDALEGALRRVHDELAELREERLAPAEDRLDVAEGALALVASEATRLRDEVVPAMVGRSDVLLERLAAEIEELGSLVERMLIGESLPVPGLGSVDESKLAMALAEVQPALLEAFRGPEAEIRHRLDHYLEALKTAPPVLDLGCGRGELLLLLRETGVEALGIEGDAAVAQAARRRGLDVIRADILEGLRAQPESSRGAVTAIHLFEHLEPDTLLAALTEIRRVLRPGGKLLIESPNPHSLRVGASLYWIDPTHRRPLMPETLELYLKTSGFEVDELEMLHPFPAAQLFVDAAAENPPDDDSDVAVVAARLDRLGRRLDELVNGPRDFAVWATKPGHDPS